MDVERQLAEMDKKLDRVCLLLEAQQEKVGKADNVIFGRNGAPGLVIRLDRLEQNQAKGAWLIRAVIGAIVALAVASFWAIMTG